MGTFATGTFSHEIELQEFPIPTPQNPQVGSIFVDFAAHRQAKRDGKTFNVLDIAYTVRIEWLNKEFGKGGHTFFVKIANENGDLQQVMIMDPDQIKGVKIGALYPTHRAGVFGLTGVQLDSINKPGLSLAKDRYRVTNWLDVEYEIT